MRVKDKPPCLPLSGTEGPLQSLWFQSSIKKVVLPSVGMGDTTRREHRLKARLWKQEECSKGKGQGAKEWWGKAWSNQIVYPFPHIIRLSSEPTQATVFVNLPPPRPAIPTNLKLWGQSPVLSFEPSRWFWWALKFENLWPRYMHVKGSQKAKEEEMVWDGYLRKCFKDLAEVGEKDGTSGWGYLGKRKILEIKMKDSKQNKDIAISLFSDCTNLYFFQSMV